MGIASIAERKETALREAGLAPEELPERSAEPDPPMIEMIEKKTARTLDAPLCYQCGSKMQPSGSCYVCASCGSTSGCS